MIINFLSEKYSLLVQSELSVLWGKTRSGNTDKTGIQRSSYGLGASDLTTAHWVAASDVRRCMTLQALRPMGRVGQFPAGRKPLEGRGQLSVYVC